MLHGLRGTLGILLKHFNSTNTVSRGTCSRTTFFCGFSNLCLVHRVWYWSQWLLVLQHGVWGIDNHYNHKSIRNRVRIYNSKQNRFTWLCVHVWSGNGSLCSESKKKCYTVMPKIKIPDNAFILCFTFYFHTMI